ncbi:MAG: hypothetical protein DBX55_02655 [Verrucomicrobia bacterium]|nr:MAG: hypothetical protein DBX55_02655 [Verrucomicrobiota bacterium]
MQFRRAQPQAITDKAYSPAKRALKKDFASRSRRGNFKHAHALISIGPKQKCRTRACARKNATA